MIKAAIIHRKITLLFVLLIACIGFYQYYQMPKQENPDLIAPYAMVTTIYPGASPEDVKELVTDKIEEKIHEISGVNKTMTQSRSNVSIVIVELESSTDIDGAWDQLYRMMDQLNNELPDRCLPIEVNTNLYNTAGMIISLSSTDFSYDELETFAESYIKELSKIDGVSTFDIVGKQQRQITIEIDMDLLNNYPLSLEDLSNLIASQNVKIPAGQLNSKNGKVAINTAGTYAHIEDIENVVILISPDDGSALRLKDIATIYYEYSDSNFKIRQNGENAILLTAYFKEGQNILLIGDDVKATIDKVSESLPESLQIHPVLYQPDDVKESINGFMMNLIQGIIIVILVVLLGLGMRNAIIVSVAIPMSILTTFMLMPILDMKIHQVSIVALIIVLGMLVDNAIVISDAIQVRIDEGFDQMKACVHGVKSVAIPVLTSTLTTIGAFVAILFLSGLAGEFIASLPKILIIALTASYVIAILVTPSLAYIFFRPSKASKDLLRGVKKGFRWMLHRGIKHPKLTMLIAILGVIASIGFIVKVDFALFPIADNNIIHMDIYSDGTDDMERTEEIVQQVETLLEKEDEVTLYTSALGGALPKFYYSMSVYPSTPDFAQIFIRFDLEGSKYESQKAYASHLQKVIDTHIVGGDIQAKLLKQAEPIPALRYVVTGGDVDELHEVTSKMVSLMRKTPGTMNVRSDFSPEEFQFDLQVNPAIAMYYGISKYDVQKEVSLAVAGREVSTYIHDGEEYPIVIKGDLTSVDELDNFGIKSSITQGKTLVKQVAQSGLKKQVTNIKTYSNELAVTVMGDIRDGYNATSLTNKIEPLFKNIYQGSTTITPDGEKASIIELFGDVGVLAVVAVVLVFGVLLIQFKSYLQPLLICITLPLACVGSLAGLFIMNEELSFTALIGMVSLIGIVVNNAIVLLDFIKEEEKKGVGVEKACIQAVEQRFRPIILSSFTTIMGLIPLLLSGQVMFVPMAVALIFGLLVSTLLTLVFFPVLYYWVYGRLESNN